MAESETTMRNTTIAHRPGRKNRPILQTRLECAAGRELLCQRRNTQAGKHYQCESDILRSECTHLNTIIIPIQFTDMLSSHPAMKKVKLFSSKFHFKSFTLIACSLAPRKLRYFSTSCIKLIFINIEICSFPILFFIHSS